MYIFYIVYNNGDEYEFRKNAKNSHNGNINKVQND